MNRGEVVRQIWAWLPAFRVVAETQHLSQAALRLGVTPAALSRTIAKLERTMGVRLFERVARGMLLTVEGARLADGVRDTMRRVDDVMGWLQPRTDKRELFRLAFDDTAVGVLLDLAMPALLKLGARLAVSAVPGPAMAAALLAGEIDIALSRAPAMEERVVCKPIAEVKMRWVTANTHLELSASTAPVLELPPSVGQPSFVLLRHSVLAVPAAAKLEPSVRSTLAPPITLWRLTRTRPSAKLLKVAAEVARASLGK